MFMKVVQTIGEKEKAERKEKKKTRMEPLTQES